MPQAANIVLADAAGTPVNHTFVPVGRDNNGVYWFEDQSASTPLGYWKISLELRKPSAAQVGQSSDSSRVIKAVINLHEPVLETLGTNDAGVVPPPTVGYIQRSKCEFILPERSTLLDRKHIRKMTTLLVNDASVIAMVESLQNIY